MAFIEPKNTTVEIYKNVPLDIDYRNTVIYSTQEEQYNDFQQYLYKKYDHLSYQRWGLGTIRLEEYHANLYNCNYMIFENKQLQKKIYCFITGTAYISTKVTEVYYQIDVLQTYMCDYTFNKCFVEREHVYTDIQGTNTQPEGLEIGNSYIYDNVTKLESVVKNWTYVVLATSYPSGQTFSTPKLQNGILNGLYYYSTTDANTISSLLKTYVDQGLEDNIVSLYMAPVNDSTSGATMLFQRNTLAGYTPRNKKLLTYPYCFYQIGNNLGNYIELKYENMGKLSKTQSDGSVRREFTWKVVSYDFPQPIMIFQPSYLNIYPNRDYELNYSVFPTCAFSGDSFKVWWAQNKNSYIATMNSIQSNYDTNVSVANNNYAIAKNNALSTKQQTLNSVNTSLTNAKAQQNTAIANAKRTYNTATSTLSSGASSGLSDVAGTIGSSISSGISGLTGMVGNLFGNSNAATSVTQNNLNIASRLQNTLNQSNIQASNNLQASELSANTAYQVAQNSANTNAKNASLAYSTALKNATLSQASANLSALTTAQNATAELVAKKQDAQHQPNTAHGQSACDGANVSLGRVGFYGVGQAIKDEYAMMIDDYFDLYGYAVNTLKYPNLDNRKYYTYIKCANCSIKPIAMDSQTRQTIEEIYNNGITTWKALSQVGDYSLASKNTPNGEQY